MTTLTDEGLHGQIWRRYPLLGDQAGRNSDGKPCFSHSGFDHVTRVERLLAVAFMVKDHAETVGSHRSIDHLERLNREFYELAGELEGNGRFLLALAEDMKRLHAKHDQEANDMKRLCAKRAQELRSDS
jgi:hypothetical protein